MAALMDKTMASSVLIGLALTVMLLLSTVRGDDMKDVVESEDVTLECRFGPHLISREPTFYWSRTNTRDKDNVAIGETPLEQNYAIEFRPQEGRYDLKIRNATYDRDNGKFECRMKEKGSGHELHSKIVQLTVLLPPGPPRITPLEPTATEGRSIDLTCSSSGGSPDPIIRWYRNGMSYPLDSIIKNGGSRTSPTSAILSVTPQRDDDGSEYRSVVWNRALPEGEKLEASVNLNVNYYPRVRVGPENPLRVEKGQSARLSCNVDSKPAVSSVKWTRNGRFSETSFTYTIPRASLQDAGTYVCTAENGLGQSGEADLTLEVLYAPIVSLVPKKEVEEGENVWVKCNVTSNPRPSSIEWLKKVSDVPAVAQVGMRVHYVIGGVVSGIVLLLCLGLIMLFCCCRKKKVVKKDYEMNRGNQQVVPPPYYTQNGMENKGMERTMDVIEDTLKNNFNGGQNGYISYNGFQQPQLPNGNGNIPYIDQNSYSNSNNGGSVNSQDSLWKAAHIVPNDQQQQQHQQIQLSQQQQLHQQQIQHNNMLLSSQQQPESQLHTHRGNYEHQYVTDEYVPYQNSNNYATDPYGPIPKPKRRLDLIGDNSPYHDLSGLPDPYLTTLDVTSQDKQPTNRTQQVTMSFEESLESGYRDLSTPNSRNRRVIREIIV